jgi:hypothetical protein
MSKDVATLEFDVEEIESNRKASELTSVLAELDQRDLRRSRGRKPFKERTVTAEEEADAAFVGGAMEVFAEEYGVPALQKLLANVKEKRREKKRKKIKVEFSDRFKYLKKYIDGAVVETDQTEREFRVRAWAAKQLANHRPIEAPCTATLHRAATAAWSAAFHDLAKSRALPRRLKDMAHSAMVAWRQIADHLDEQEFREQHRRPSNEEGR